MQKTFVRNIINNSRERVRGEPILLFCSQLEISLEGIIT